MSQISNITPSGERPWLESVHKKQKERTIALGKKTIDTLVTDRIPVTYKNIHEKSKELDIEGKGIHPNTIKKNDDLYDYYKQHSRTFKIYQRKRKPVKNLTIDESTIRRISPNRNLSNIRKKYMALSKEELVKRLIETEQYVALNQKRWVAEHFKSFV